MEESKLLKGNENIIDSITIDANMLSDGKIDNFALRKEIIEKVIGEIMSKSKFSVNINLNNVNVDASKVERFVIEIIPRLKEIGASLVITNNNILSSEFLEIHEL